MVGAGGGDREVEGGSTGTGVDEVLPKAPAKDESMMNDAGDGDMNIEVRSMYVGGDPGVPVSGTLLGAGEELERYSGACDACTAVSSDGRLTWCDHGSGAYLGPTYTSSV
jgi:hypothetical protein